MIGYKTGANQQDQNAIKRLMAEGKSAEEISKAIAVELPCVQSFVDFYNGKAASKSAPAPVTNKPKRKAREATPAPPEPPPLPDPPPVEG